LPKYWKFIFPFLLEELVLLVISVLYCCVTVKAKGVTVSTNTLAFRYEPWKCCCTITIELHWRTFGYFSMLTPSICRFSLLYFNKVLNIAFFFYQNKNGLELVPQHRYPQVMTQAPVDAQSGTGWDAMGRYQSGMGGGMVANADDMGRYSPLGSR
jgi:hypothetical protein